MNILKEIGNFFKMLGGALSDTAKLNQDLGKDMEKLNKEGAKATKKAI